MYRKGEYALYCMFPEKWEIPNEIVRIAGISELECGKVRYGIEYAKWDMKDLRICVDGGSSWSWGEDCFSEIIDPIQKLIAKRQENIDKIQALDNQIDQLHSENVAIYFSLGLLVTDKAQTQERNCRTCQKINGCLYRRFEPKDYEPCDEYASRE